MIIARWESRSGKHWVELYGGDEPDETTGSFDRNRPRAFTYSAPGAGGCLGVLTADAAIEEMRRRIHDLQLFQPDSNVTPMKRVI